MMKNRSFKVRTGWKLWQEKKNYRDPWVMLDKSHEPVEVDFTLMNWENDQNKLNWPKSYFDRNKDKCKPLRMELWDLCDPNETCASF